MKYETRLIAILTFTFGFVFFDRNAANFLMPFIAKDLTFTNQQIGLIQSALSFTWAVSAFLGGWYSDNAGNRKPMLVFTVIAFSLCSFVSGIAGSFMALFLARLLMGMAEGPIMPICHSLVALQSTESNRGHNMGVVQNFGSNLLGSFAAPLVLVALASALSWRYAFFIAGLPGLLMAVLVIKYVHDKPQSAAHIASMAHDKMSLLEIVRHRNLLLCMLMAVVMVSWMVLGWVFLPVYYVNVSHFSPFVMSCLLAVLGLSAAFFSFVVPALSDRFGRRPIVIGFNLIGVIVPLSVLYFGSNGLAVGLLTFIGWSASGTFPLFMGTIPSETVSPRYVATCVGLTVGVGEVLGGVFGPFIAGTAADHFGGVSVALLIQLGCAVVGSFIGLFLIETAPVLVRGATPAPQAS